ncbi:MAG: 30S ribosomal protein S9 [Candidatus Andersenbacteria bacterium]
MASKTPQYGLGRRKTARAQVVLNSETGSRKINGIEIHEYFPTAAMQESALRALKLTSQLDTYGFKAKVSGGGKHAQAEAVELAIARALVTIDQGWRKQLKDAGLLTRDPRMKERKKPGLKRARRAPQFSKR